MAKLNDLTAPWSAEERSLFVDATPSPPAGQFELGLVLGGTVSAGAYTAGVLDFLIESLDAWDAEKQMPGSSAPDWSVRLKAVAGTSGGGVLSAILAKALSWEFPAVRMSDGPDVTSVNPFYQVWVEQLDITAMLETGDIADHHAPRALLNAACLERAANYVASFNGRQGQARFRDYVQEPLPVYLTLTNLQGLPCTIGYPGGLQQHYVDHAEYAKFYVFTQGGTPARALPDGFVVTSASGPMGHHDHADWSIVSSYALGTGAFPVGLPPRDLQLPVQQLRLRPMVVAAPGIAGSSAGSARVDVVPRAINWRMLADAQGEVPDAHPFTAVDGGVLNNEPIGLCRRELAGMTGRNERAGELAQRAVLLVDPFSDAPEMTPAHPPGMLGVAKGLIGTWKSQARYDTQDLQLAVEQNCFSRFLITAQRAGADVGGRSIACASLSAFGGFLSKEFRRHDYFLGRKNCRDFLMQELLIPAENQAMFGAWKAAHPMSWSQWLIKDALGRDCLPLIPLFGACRSIEQVPPYPTGRFNPDARSFNHALEDRIEAVLDGIVDEQDYGSLSTWLIKQGIELFDDDLADRVKEAIKSGLRDWRLI